VTGSKQVQSEYSKRVRFSLDSNQGMNSLKERVQY
jgi:hypothetical protein